MFGLITLSPSSFWKFSDPEEIADYLSVFSSYEGRNATLNWYRANRELPVQYGDVYLPTLLIWGNTDIAVGRAGMEATPQYMKGEYTFVELDAGHTLVQEQFERVEWEIIAHLQRHPIKV